MIALAALCLAGALSVVLLMLTAARASGWRDRRAVVSFEPWLLAIWVLLTIGLGVALAGGPTLLDKVGAALLGLWLVVSVILHVIGRRRTRVPHPTRSWGARAAHAGVAIAIAGMILSALFSSEIRRSMAPGDKVRFDAWTVQLHDVWPAAGEDWVGVKAELRASGGDGVVLLEPQLRMIGGEGTSEPSSLSSGTGVLRASVGTRTPDGKWPILLGSVPFLTMIPVGALIAASGGILALVGPPIARRRRRRQIRLATAWWA